MFQQDKILHFLVCFLLTLLFALVCGKFLAVLIVLFIGWAKEIYDKYFGSYFSIGDIIADVVGILVALLFI